MLSLKYIVSTADCHLLQRLNRFTIWVASQIVWPVGLKQRTDVMEKFLKIGQVSTIFFLLFYLQLFKKMNLSNILYSKL